MGILKDKDINGILKEIVYLADKVFFVQSDSDRAFSSIHLYRLAKEFICKDKIEYFYSVAQGLKKAISYLKPEELLCVAGSLYTVGEARRYLYPYIKKERIND